MMTEIFLGSLLGSALGTAVAICAIAGCLWAAYRNDDAVPPEGRRDQP